MILGEIEELELPVNTPLPCVLEFAEASEKALLRGTPEDEAEREASVDHTAEAGREEVTETNEAFDRTPVITSGEAYEAKIVLVESETATASKLVDGPLGEIGDTGVKDVLFQKLWYGFPGLTGIGGWAVAEDTAVPPLVGVAKN